MSTIPFTSDLNNIEKLNGNGKTVRIKRVYHVVKNKVPPPAPPEIPPPVKIPTPVMYAPPIVRTPRPTYVATPRMRIVTPVPSHHSIATYDKDCLICNAQSNLCEECIRTDSSKGFATSPVYVETPTVNRYINTPVSAVFPPININRSNLASSVPSAQNSYEDNYYQVIYFYLKLKKLCHELIVFLIFSNRMYNLKRKRVGMK